MAGKRHNIDTIAEVLIDKIEDMEKIAGRIEKASEKTLKVNVSELRELLVGQKREEKHFLSELQSLKKKNQFRLPNWVFTLLCIFFLGSIGFSVYAWKKAEAYDYANARADHYEQKYIELKKQEK